MTEAYPLHWPAGWPRTKNPRRSKFDVSFEKARQELTWEIERMGGRYPVISTNIPTRRDGYPLASAKEPNDSGVAVYFERKGKQMVFACDRWDKVKDNLRAVQKTIDAMRGIDRWGASEMMERAFSAFEALPPPRSPWTVLGLRPGAHVDDINEAYRLQAKKAHPDAGGSTDAMAELNRARDAALRQVQGVAA